MRKNNHRIVQVKSLLENLEISLNKDFDLEKYHYDKDMLVLIDSLISSLDLEEEVIPEDPVIQEDTKPATSTQGSSQTTPTKEVSQKPVAKAPAKEKKAAKPIAKTVKIDLNDIDSMMDIVGEMLVIKKCFTIYCRSIRCI